MIRGRYVRKLVDNYCVLDFETTGLSFGWDEIIEVGILKVRNNTIIDKFETLVKPSKQINGFIEELTGITNEMLSNAPAFKEVEDNIFEFIGNDLIVGHNTSFDLNFLYSMSGKEFTNEYIDTLQFCRKLYPNLKHHRLCDMVEHLNISQNSHRSIDDCITTFELYSIIKSRFIEDNLKIEDLFFKERKEYCKSYNFKDLDTNSINPDYESVFYQKYCCFTGTLEKMVRKDAAQLVINIGGFVDNSVTKKTNFLIIGNFDYCTSLKEGKSSKHKKAEQLKLKGQDIEVIDENTFYELIENRIDD